MKNTDTKKRYKTMWEYLKDKHGNKFCDQTILLEDLMDEVENTFRNSIESVKDV